MSLRGISTVAAALTMAVALGAPAQAYEFNTPWGYAFIDDQPFLNPANGQLGLSTQVFPRGRINDVRPPDGYDVRLTMFTFTPGNAHSQASPHWDEGDFVVTPFSAAIDIAPRQISYVAFDFCRLVPGTDSVTDCQPRLRIGRPEPPQPPGGGGGGPAPTDPDRDGDGIPASRDCADNNATVWPGAREIPGNKLDDDCVGGDAAARITAGVTNDWRVRGARTRVRALRVSDAPAEATVELRCLGKRCHFARRTTAVDAKGGANLRRFLRKPLRPGMTIEVRITAPNWIGKVMRYRIRRGKLPAKRTLCLAPNAKKPERC
jgi:Putative metal-binding motif